MRPDFSHAPSDAFWPRSDGVPLGPAAQLLENLPDAGLSSGWAESLEAARGLAAPPVLVLSLRPQQVLALFVLRPGRALGIDPVVARSLRLELVADPFGEYTCGGWWWSVGEIKIYSDPGRR